MRFVARFLLRAAVAYALLYAAWLPLRSTFTRLVADVAGAVLRSIDDPVLISNLTATGSLIEFHSPLANASGPLAGWNAVDLAVFMLAPLALALAAPGARVTSRIRVAIPLAGLLGIFCVALAVVQIKLAAEMHASAEMGIRLHSAAEAAWLHRANDVLHVVGMLALPTFVFLATYVYSAWVLPAKQRTDGKSTVRGGSRSWIVAAITVVVCAAAIGGLPVLVPPPTGDDAEARRRAWTRVVELNPEFAPAQVNLGLQLEQANDPERAIELYRGALDADPDLVPAHYNLGNALRGQGRFAEAIESYEEALRRSPEHGHAHRNLGVALARLDRSCEAAAHLRESGRLDPSFAADPGLRSSLEKLDAACRASKP